MSWSSGKDSAMALHAARQEPALEVVALLSTFNECAARVAIHGTRREVARAQAAALGLPLIEVDLPAPCPNAVYEERLGAATRRLRDDGVEDWIFGDLFLDDIRAYREAQLAPLGLAAHFPLWGRDTRALAQEMLAAGIDARIVTLDPQRLPPALCGARFDAGFLAALPEGVDPCGERGEFHTVVAQAPGFAAALDLRRGATVAREGFVYTDFTLGAAG
ncbi:ATP-binding protein [Rhodosalinus halophilus]|uniref:ATP-binding protein n=2 Tax=Rhodosalinus halophilus TaxID=2259333 RepID=A0A365UDD4_9RHOB|nr:ATP-binding protein [Rhodosalinus halophilus]